MMQPKIDIDPETYEVKLDGKIATVDPATEPAQSMAYYVIRNSCRLV